MVGSDEFCLVEHGLSRAIDQPVRFSDGEGEIFIFGKA